MSNEYYCPEVSWEDHAISVRQYDFNIVLSEHVSQEEYTAMTVEQREKFIADLAMTESQKIVPFKVEIIDLNTK